MKIHTFFSLTFLFMASGVWACNYVYPVALCPGRSKSIVVLHQNTHGNLKLFGWDAHTKSLEALLPWQYCPTGVGVLPDARGISFIDNDRLRIKFFAKRSPRSCDFPYPVQQLHPVIWSENGKGYCSALYHGHYALFEVDQEGDCRGILASKMADYMYPNCIRDTLYFIERRVETTGCGAHYSVKMLNVQSLPKQRLPWASLDEYYSFCIKHDETDILLPDAGSAHCLIDCGQQSIMHLSMINDSFGWVLTYSHDNGLSPRIELTCCMIQFVHDQWHIMKAFNFTVPYYLVFGDLGVHNEGRLYESLLPLLPRYIRSSLYFTSMDESGFLGIYSYDPRDAHIERRTPAGTTIHFFAPLESEIGIVCGENRVDEGLMIDEKLHLRVLKEEFKF